jgi:hypothetical protein
LCKGQGLPFKGINSMMTYRAFSIMAVTAIGCLGLCSCSTASKCDCQAANQATSIMEIDSLYTSATTRHHQPFRKPVQDAQARTLNTLSQKAEQLAAQTACWDSPARLTSLSEAGRESALQDIHGFRSGLAGIRAAAEARNLACLRQQYAVTRGAYGRLVEQVDVNN